MNINTLPTTIPFSHIVSPSGAPRPSLWEGFREYLSYGGERPPRGGELLSGPHIHQRWRGSGQQRCNRMWLPPWRGRPHALFIQSRAPVACPSAHILIFWLFATLRRSVTYRASWIPSVCHGGNGYRRISPSFYSHEVDLLTVRLL